MLDDDSTLMTKMVLKVDEHQATLKKNIMYSWISNDGSIEEKAKDGLRVLKNIKWLEEMKVIEHHVLMDIKLKLEMDCSRKMFELKGLINSMST